ENSISCHRMCAVSLFDEAGPCILFFIEGRVQRMHIVGVYAFNNGKDVIARKHRQQLDEVWQVIQAVDAEHCQARTSRVSNRERYGTSALNYAFREQFLARSWQNYKVAVEYSKNYYVPGYIPRTERGEEQQIYREMDFVKNRLGIEMQFDKGSFGDIIYDICAKMTIFANLDVIDCGIEIVPVKGLAEVMSTGVSYFEQFVWDLEHRGVADIDIPVLIIGIDTDGVKPRELKIAESQQGYLF
ncbi:MAG TPA: BglII/BstYI family type II restriction endonuclease, partial [Ktedonobacteraceae bacterium]|nr:BglII/BstYI family type II restriction endonuclease [Ktedonobacteraceae bacterium]